MSRGDDRSAVQSLMLTDVRLTEVPSDVLTVNDVAEGFSFLAPFGDGWYPRHRL